MFIEPEGDRTRPPPGGQCLVESKGADMNTDGRVPIGPGRLRFYKHCPPGGGRAWSSPGLINIALLTEGGPGRLRVL